MEKEKIDILLKEYDTCEQKISLHINRYWVAVGIFIGINTGLLGFGYTKIASLSTSFSDIELIEKCLVTCFGLAAIVMVLLLERWGKRINWLIRLSYYRIQEIEEILEMRVNLYVNILDEMAKLPKEKLNDYSQSYQKLYRQFPPQAHEFKNIQNIFLILISLWAILIFVIWYFPIIKAFFNIWYFHLLFQLLN